MGHGHVGLLVVTLLVQSALSKICMGPVCEYTLSIRQQRTMTYRNTDGVLYDVEADKRGLIIVPNLFKLDDGMDPLINTYVDPAKVLAVEGTKRNIITINDQFPGPTIEVMENTKIVVNIENNMLREGVSIHWHGMYQRNSQWYDGVPNLTQCPIHPGQSFQYRFTAYPSGTHWYHSHIRSQRLDGLYGMIIVHKSPPVLPSHQLLIQDYTETEYATIMLTRPFSTPQGSGEFYLNITNRDQNIDGIGIGWQPEPIGIINGKGRRGNKNKVLPLERYTVERGQKYRFRMLNAGADYGYEISIDGHEFDVVASDGYEIQPIRVTSIYIEPAETMDIEVVTNRPGGPYWVRANVPKFSPPSVDPTPNLGFAVLAYKGLDNGRDPVTTQRVCTATERCKVFNCHFKGFATYLNRECYDFNDAKSTLSTAALDEEFGLRDPSFVGKFMMIGADGPVIAINNKVFVPPTAPLLTNYKPYDDQIVNCDKTNCDDICDCTHIVDLPFDETIELAISNILGIFSHHPMHIHGHGMAVLKLGFPEYDPATGLTTEPNNEIQCDDTVCSSPKWKNGRPRDLNLINPPIKDTITVPSQGYALVRFKTNNPGLWLFHCHLNNHFSGGMTLIFRVAENKIGRLPEGFPTCRNFKEKLY